MEDYNVEDRLITKEDWENWLKSKEEYSDKRLSNMPETPTKKETKYAVIEWHQYPKEKPKKSDDYLVSIKAGDKIFTYTAYWIDPIGIFELRCDGRILAWAEMLAPYKEQKNDQSRAN